MGFPKREKGVTNMEEHLDHAKTISRWNMVTAALLFASPFVFSYVTSTAASLDDYIVGIVVFVLAAIRQYISRKNVGLSWVNAILALWLIASPFILAFTSVYAIWTNMILGLIIGILSIASASETNRYAHAAH
jgi:hypothetical protein